MFNRILFLLIMFLCSGYSVAASDYNFTPTYEPATKSYKIPLVRDGWNKAAFIEVRVNGSKALFLINIGSSYTFISETFAKKNGLTLRSPSAKGGGNPKGRTMKLTFVDSLLVGKTDFKNFDLVSLNLEHLDKALPFNVDGIIGGNILPLYPFKLDLKNNYVEFNVTFQPNDGFNFIIENNKVIFSAIVNGISSEFQLNTGSKKTKISNLLLEKFNSKNGSLRNITVNYVDEGERKIKKETVNISSLNFLNKRLTNVDVEIGSKNMISMDVLKSEIISLDYKNKKIKLGE